MILARMGRRRLLVSIPFELADPLAHLLEALPRGPLTVAQVDLLKADNVPAPGLPGVSKLGIVPRKILRRYCDTGSSLMGLFSTWPAPVEVVHR